MKKFIIYLFILIFPLITFSQEYITGLVGNPVIKSYLKKKNIIPQFKSYIKEYPPISLPFFDDFSYPGVYPDTSLWIDNEAYVNSHFAIFPVNFGVATFDVLDANGDLYPHAGTFSFIADHLTSYPIRLDSIIDENYKITPADSIYFSFYYQPQGRGDIPLSYDSLVLDFGIYNGDTVFAWIDSVQVYGYDYLNQGEPYILPLSQIQPPLPCDTSLWYTLLDTLFYNDSIMIPCDSIFVLDTEWTSVWSAEGDTLDVFIEENDVYFKRVMIPVTDTAWLKKDFQFRFMNYGSLSVINSWQSNTDHWNVDMVYLNIGRSKDDIYLRDICFTENSQSFVKNYYSMPFWQYDYYLKKDTIDIYAHNLDSADHTCTYNYYVQDQEGDTLHAFHYDGFTGIMSPYFNQTISEIQPFVKPPVKYFFTSTFEDSVKFRISHVIYDEDSVTIGDTMIFHQQFSNYFAYDDGTAERGYGLSPAGAKLAYKFKLENPDTLRGLQMFFNKTMNNANDRLIDICVWNDDNGKPGYLIYAWENRKPVFNNGFNVFHTYIFPEYLVLGAEVFYVGWIQLSDMNMNVGFDRNTNSRTKIFYDVNGTWINSSFEGSLMIRPVVGKALPGNIPTYKSQPANLVIYPNPPESNGLVSLILPSGYSDPEKQKYLKVRIFDICGKLIFTVPYSEKPLNVSILKQGLYIVNLFDAAYTRNYSAKLLIFK